MTIKITTVEAKDRWNAFVADWPDFELMQTYEWGGFKSNLGWKAIRIAVEQNERLIAGAQILIKQLPLHLASLAYIPRGPLVNWQDKIIVRTLLEAIGNITRQYRAISLKIEPAVLSTPETLQNLESCGFRRSQYNNQPQSSMIIDLTPDHETILAKMHKSTRYNIRYSERQGVTIYAGDEHDLPTFYRLLRFTAQKAGFPVRSFDYFRQEWNALAKEGQIKLFLAMQGNEVIAMRMPAAFGGKAATFHSGSFEAYRKLRPNELLMWECLKWAKAQGCKTYDVWGIPDEIGEILNRGEIVPEDQKGGLWGVYYFKRGFGGEPVYYVGAYDFIYSQPLYRLMNAVLSRLGSLDKFVQLGERLSLKPEFPTGV